MYNANTNLWGTWMGAKHAPLSERFWRYVDKTDGCWLWTGSVDTSGYGHIKDEVGRLVRATHVSYALHSGVIPHGARLCHTCDVLWSDLTYRRCVRPDHLWPGTDRENTQDCIAKNRFPFAANNPTWRQRRPRGESHVRAKLTEDIVRQIRLEYRPAYGGPTTQSTSMRGLARKYGVSKAVVQQIIHGQIWQHVI